MQVYVTPDHDVSMINSQTKTMTSDEIAANLYAAAMSDSNTEAEHDFHYVDSDEYYGDEYANEVINSIGFFNAHYGEL